MTGNDWNLTDRFRSFLAEQVASGRYANESEVLQAALRLLERQTREEEQKLARLREAIDVGFADIDAGRYDLIEGEEELREYVEAIGRRVSEQMGRERGA